MLRIDAGLEGSELARIVGVSKQTIYNIERNRYGTRPGLALAIATALGVTVRDLINTQPAATTAAA